MLPPIQNSRIPFGTILPFPKVGGLFSTNPSLAPLNVALNIYAANNGRPIFTKMDYPPWVFEFVAPLYMCVCAYVCFLSLKKYHIIIYLFTNFDLLIEVDTSC